MMSTIENQNTVPILILGPRGSGKTTFLYKTYFKYATDNPDTHFDVISTPTYNVEIIPYKSHLYQLWDFAGNNNNDNNNNLYALKKSSLEISSCLQYIKDNIRVIIYMVDSVEYSKPRVSAKSRENMVWLLSNFDKVLENTIIITVCNKQSEGVMDIQDIGNCWVKDKSLMELLKGHDWRVFGSESRTGKGIDSILEYITLKLEHRKILLVTPWDSLPNPNHQSDLEFKQWFYQEKQFLFFDHYCLIRIIYLTIMNEKPPSTLYDILSSQLLTADSTPNNNNTIHYSETQTLFWIQMVSFSLLKYPLLEGEDNNFNDFLLRCKLQQDGWKEYYTFKLFYSSKAAKQFLPPDKKSLPNAFKSSSLALKGRHLEIDYQVL
ncbi:hypothetical protein INT48_000089 [Thamnidium elegans]|uniref:Uncharacterized protein n=1 Tax=Thamnidium elegans TaxID=101142 RepID=A0A8H7VVI1_9FUNG|nr:hypothetical protein INT48_000089 [Thamnidium elegans]